MTAPLEDAIRDLVRELVREELARSAPATSAPRLYSVAQAAEQLGLSRAFVYRELVNTGRLPSTKIGGRRLISEAAIRAFITAGSDAS